MTGIVGTANTLSGQYGDMNIDMLLRKQEQTCMYEPEDMVEQHIRGIIKDFRPDPPFLASDEQRVGTDKNGNPRIGNVSNQAINLRSGARTLTDPYLPDGTFLDFQFTENDPRGIALEPDMRKHANQQYARGQFYNYRDDSDNSITESGWNPWNAQMQIRNAQTVTKDYFKIFETSKDSWTNGGAVPGYVTSVKESVVEDQEIKDPVHAPNINRIDITNNLSNDTSIGWRRTTDHRFSVAKYGKPNTSKLITTDNYYNNRANAHTDHNMYVSWQNNKMLKSTALLMMDLSKQKETNKNVGKDNIIFGISNKENNRKQKLGVNDMAGVNVRPSYESRTTDPHTLIKGELAPTSGEKLLIQDVKTIEKTHINPTIVEKMSNVNRQNTLEKKDDLRNAIKKSADDKGIYMTEINKQNITTFDPSSLWSTISIYNKGKSLSVNNYKTATKKIEEGGKKLDKLSKDINFKESYTHDQRRGKLNINKNQNVNTSKIDNDYGIEVERNHLVGPLGTKYMTKYIDRDNEHNSINDTDRRR